MRQSTAIKVNYRWSSHGRLTTLALSDSLIAVRQPPQTTMTDAVYPAYFNETHEMARATARRYNALARDHGLTPTQMALAFCYTKWQVASTIIGVTSVAQLDEDLDAYGTTLSPELLAEIDKIRWDIRDPAL